MVRFTFISGKEQEFDYNWEKLAPKLQHAGLRLFKPAPDMLVPLNSNTISFIENIPGEEKDAPEPEKAEEPQKESEPKEEKVEEKETDPEEERKKIIEHMKEMSSCTHEDYVYFYQDVTAGARGNQTTSKRFFPVCTKCGIRQRFVKAESLTDEEKENAKVWDK